jgi:hypothetical protein
MTKPRLSTPEELAEVARLRALVEANDPDEAWPLSDVDDEDIGDVDTHVWDASRRSPG